MFERLEQRALMAVFTVVNGLDSGPGSLRDAIAGANASGGADIVEFSPGLAGSSITLSGGELVLEGALTITGPGAGSLSVSGGGASRVFAVDAGATVAISGLSIVGGRGDFGGGISNYGVLTLTGVTVRGCSADYGGGGVFSSAGTLTVRDSTITGNTTSGSGGGIEGYGTVVVLNSTISGNSAATGGGIDAFNGELTVTNSTIAANLGGAGLYVDPGFSASATIISTIVAGNAGGDVVGRPLAPGSVHNLVGDGATGGGLANGSGGNIVGADPLLGPLVDNGGPSRTMALLAGSPAIGAGSNPGSLAFDQRGAGFARVRGGAIDIGAFEFNAAPTIAALTPGAGAIEKGDSLALVAANAADPDGSVVSVSFFADTDADGVPDAGELLGTDGDSAGGFSYTLTGAQTLALPSGTVTFLAVATDNDGAASAPRACGVSVALAAADRFIQTYAAAPKNSDGLVDGDWIAGTLTGTVSNVVISDAYWGARNHWFQDKKGDVWALWHGGAVHASTTLPGQHEWVLTNLTDAGGLSGTMHFAPGSLSGITTGWNAFNIQGIQNGTLTALWWSPAGSAGSYVDTDGQTKQGGAWGLRGNGWSLSSISGAAVPIGGALTVGPGAFLAYSESQGNGRTEFDPRALRAVVNTGMSVVVVDTNLRVFVVTFSVSQRAIAGARPDLNGTWVLEPLREAPSLADLGLSGTLDAIEQAYVSAATK